jgi:4-hydroxy-3-methylbut-2-enyl diphosphate reductase
VGEPVSRLQVRISESAGFCWGVERALERALKASVEAPGPVRSLGPLIHNPGVIADLQKRGVEVVSAPEQAPDGTVILRSHGVPREVKERLEAADITVVDATCRYVKSAQVKAARLRRLGYFVIILGERDHPEVLALHSYAGENSLVVESPGDLPQELPSQRVGVVVQTTQSQEHLVDLVSRLAPRTRELLVYNTICNATEQRQAAAMTMAEQVDAVVVVGGRNSGNTRRLAELCSARQPRTYHVEAADELDPAWFRGLRVVGVTAGASTPPDQIKAVAERLTGFDV